MNPKLNVYQLRAVIDCDGNHITAFCDYTSSAAKLAAWLDLKPIDISVDGKPVRVAFVSSISKVRTLEPFDNLGLAWDNTAKKWNRT